MVHTTDCAIAPLWAANVQDKPLQWFYPSVFVRSELNGIQGIPGDGKSWLMCELAAKTSTGGTVQGVGGNTDFTKLPCGNVLYISGDDTPERLKERLTSCEANLSRIAFAPEGGLPQIGSLEMEQLFAQTHPTLCVVDTLQHFIGKANANDMAAITNALQPLQTLARRYNTAVVIVMHISKFAACGNGGDSTGYSIGSYAIAGIFRSLWTLGRLKDENGRPSTLRALCQSKNNYSDFDPPALLFELRKGFQWAGIETELTAEDLYNKVKVQRGRPADKIEGVKSVILQLLDVGNPVLSTELNRKVMDVTGCSSRTLQSAKNELQIKCFQVGQQWFCSLPGQSAINR